VSKLLVGRWDAIPHCEVRSSLAVWGEHVLIPVSPEKGEQGIPSFAIYCTSLCGERKKGFQKYRTIT